jgi:hypothetical protein
MRHAAYILILIVVWAASIGAIMLGLDGAGPVFLWSGFWWGGVCTTALAEETAEVMGIGQRHCFVPARGGAKISAPSRRG